MRKLFLALLLLTALSLAQTSPPSVEQGGLVDLRHGQVCLEMQGFGRIFDYGAKTRFTLDGKPTTPETLASLLAEGQSLSAVARVDNRSGRASSVDVSSGRKMRAVEVRLQPKPDLPLAAGRELKLFVPNAELKRLGLRKPWLSIPGLVHKMPLQPTPDGARAGFTLEPGAELRRLPIYLSEGDKEVFRGQQFGVTSNPPQLGSGGPRVVEASLIRVPAWVELSGPTDLLDHGATSLSVSGGGKIENILTRPNRIEFWLVLPTTGSFTVKAKIKDRLGRASESTWVVTK